MKGKRFLYDRLCVNVLAKDPHNSKEIYEATEGHVIVGVLSADYDRAEEAVEAMREFDEAIDGAVSVGLGAGDPTQSEKVVEILRTYHPEHVNQVFTGVGASRAALNQRDTWINALVQPTGIVGSVNIATGPASSKSEGAVVSVETAIKMVKDMGGNSLKFFPMKGLETRSEYKALAEICAKHNFALEPTGGIDLNNFGEIIEIALEAGVPKVIPHVYSSIIDKETKKTKMEDIIQIYEIMKEIGKKHT